MSKETVKKDFANFIETYMITFKNKVYSTYPDISDISEPFAVIEIITSIGKPLIKSSTVRKSKYTRMVRIYFIDTSAKKLDTHADNFCSVYNEHIENISACIPFSISSVSNVYPVYEAKYGMFAVKIDINVIEFI